MMRVWRFLRRDGNRNVLSWIGTLFAAIVGGLWVAYTHFADPQKASEGRPNVTATCGSIALGGHLLGGTITVRSEGRCGDAPGAPGP